MRIQRRLRSLVLRKNIAEKCAEVRAEFPEYGVKFHSEYRQYAVAYFPCLAKKISPKNVLRFRAEFPEHCVKFRLKYACTSALIFLVLRKNITEKCAEVRAELLP